MDSKTESKAEEFLAALAGKIPLTSASLEVTTVDVFENIVSSLEKGKIRKIILSDLEGYYTIFESIFEKRKAGAVSDTVTGKPNKREYLAVSNTSQLFPLLKIRNLLRDPALKPSLEVAAESFNENGQIHTNIHALLVSLQCSEKRVAFNDIASVLLKSPSLLQTGAKQDEILLTLLSRLAITVGNEEPSQIESISCIWAYSAVSSFCCGGSEKARSMVSGCLLYLCSRKPSFLTFALGFVGYWGLQLNRLKKSDDAVTSDINDLLRLLGSFLQSASRQNDDDIDTGDVAVCLLTFRAWLWTTRVTTEEMKAVQDLTFMLILSRLPFTTSFWDDVVVPSLEGHVDPAMTQKVAKKALNTAGKTKELVEWIAMSATMVTALLVSMEELVEVEVDVEGGAESMDNEDNTATAAVDGAVAMADETDEGGKKKSGEKREKGKNKTKAVTSANAIPSTHKNRKVNIEDGDEDEGDKDEDADGDENEDDYGGMLDFTIDTTGDASVLDSLAAEKQKEEGGKGKKSLNKASKKSGGHGDSGKNKSIDHDAADDYADVDGDVEVDVDVEGEDGDIGEMERELSAFTEVELTTVRVEERGGSGDKKKRRLSGKRPSDDDDAEGADANADEVVEAVAGLGKVKAGKNLAARTPKSDKKKARGNA